MNHEKLRVRYQAPLDGGLGTLHLKNPAQELLKGKDLPFELTECSHQDVHWWSGDPVWVNLRVDDRVFRGCGRNQELPVAYTQAVANAVGEKFPLLYKVQVHAVDNTGPFGIVAQPQAEVEFSLGSYRWRSLCVGDPQEAYKRMPKSVVVDAYGFIQDTLMGQAVVEGLLVPLIYCK